MFTYGTSFINSFLWIIFIGGVCFLLTYLKRKEDLFIWVFYRAVFSSSYLLKTQSLLMILFSSETLNKLITGLGYFSASCHLKHK